MKKVEIEIERLVLHGQPSTRGRAMAEAVRRELTRLAAAGGIDAGNARREIAAGVAGAVRGTKR
jgi:hypothetical protein